MMLTEGRRQWIKKLLGGVFGIIVRGDGLFCIF
ncbi:MAG: hypothetical protein LKKZDAJK_002356 [Candidatus Fervidibacter sp.]|jgi:hypothetical protein